MKTKLTMMAAMVILPLLAGCASTPIALAPVGPGPTNQKDYYSKGYLKVFSDTKTHLIGDGPPYYTHTGYSIYNESGTRLQYVANHIGEMDESPSLVKIPTGNYKVVAESAAYGRVTVPVVVQAGKVTVIHLDRGWRPVSTVSINELVRLPDGEAVGWRSSLAKASE
jgi:hypothetical protein